MPADSQGDRADPDDGLDLDEEVELMEVLGRRDRPAPDLDEATRAVLRRLLVEGEQP